MLLVKQEAAQNAPSPQNPNATSIVAPQSSSTGHLWQTPLWPVPVTEGDGSSEVLRLFGDWVIPQPLGQRAEATWEMPSRK